MSTFVSASDLSGYPSRFAVAAELLLCTSSSNLLSLSRSSCSSVFFYFLLSCSMMIFAICSSRVSITYCLALILSCILLSLSFISFCSGGDSLSKDGLTVERLGDGEPLLDFYEPPTGVTLFQVCLASITLWDELSAVSLYKFVFLVESSPSPML